SRAARCPGPGPERPAPACCAWRRRRGASTRRSAAGRRRPGRRSSRPPAAGLAAGSWRNRPHPSQPPATMMGQAGPAPEGLSAPPRRLMPDGALVLLELLGRQVGLFPGPDAIEAGERVEIAQRVAPEPLGEAGLGQGAL